MKSFFATIGILSLIGMMVIGLAQAGDTATVSATVTVQNISVTVADGLVAYGTLAVSGTKDTTSSGVNNSQTATNNGNLTETFNIKGANSTGCVWTLASSQGSEQYFHKFCNNGTCDSSPVWTALTGSYQTLATGKAVSGTQEFDLQIGVPSSTSCYTEATISVTVQATS